MSIGRSFMEEAVRIAREGVNAGHGGPFGSVVVKDGEIVGKSSNMVFATGDPTAHAEIMAIREASKTLGTPELKGCEIYTLGEPCPMCLAAIYWSGIEKVFFANTKKQAAEVGFDDSFIYRELSLPIAERCILMEHAPVKEAEKLFSEWDECVDKKDLPQT
jgi:guanine deaminase